MSKHATFSPSAAIRWMTCSASIHMEADIPEKTSEYAAEGTAAHELAEYCLTNDVDADNCLDDIINNFVVDPEMVEAVQVYLDQVRGLQGHRFIETRVDFSHIAPDGFGTADYIAVDDNTLFIVDLKYGKGVQVDAENNRQLMLYALGALHDFGHLFDIEEVCLMIVQPRMGNINEWHLSIEELNEFAEEAKAAAERALQADAPFKPSTKACQFCKAKATCRALAKHNLSIAVADFDGSITEGELVSASTLTATEVANLLPLLDGFSQWIKSIQSHALAELERGRSIPGYKLVTGRSIRRWHYEGDAERALVKLLGKENAYQKKLLSPAQAERELGKARRAEIQDLIIKPEGNPTIAPNDDKRPAIAICDFEVIEN